MTSLFFRLYSGTLVVLILTVLACDGGINWIVARVHRRKSNVIDIETHRRTELRRVMGGR